MKTIQTWVIAAVIPAAIAVSATSCTQFDSREKNSAATGALIGAGAGALLSDDRVKGAAIGGALGGGGGYLYEKSKQ